MIWLKAPEKLQTLYWDCLFKRMFPDQMTNSKKLFVVVLFYFQRYTIFCIWYSLISKKINYVIKYILIKYMTQSFFMETLERTCQVRGHLTARCYTYTLHISNPAIFTCYNTTLSTILHIQAWSNVTSHLGIFKNTRYHRFLDYGWLGFACIFVTSTKFLISENCTNSMEEVNPITVTEKHVIYTTFDV